MFCRHAACSVLAGLLILTIVPIGAQPPEEMPVFGSARIKGKVRMAQGNRPVPGAVVRAYHLDNKRIYESQPTSAQGNYEIAEVPHGYVDLSVETSDGLFVANQVVNVPPGGKVVVSFSLESFEDRPATWWADRQPREIPGLDRPATGVAELRQRLTGRAFWKSPSGVAIIAAGTGATLLAIASGGDTPASPSSP